MVWLDTTDATTDDDVADGSVSGEDDCTEETADATTGPAEENPRFYTPRECARLMGFPEDFVIDEVVCTLARGLFKGYLR